MQFTCNNITYRNSAIHCTDIGILNLLHFIVGNLPYTCKTSYICVCRQHWRFWRGFVDSFLTSKQALPSSSSSLNIVIFSPKQSHCHAHAKSSEFIIHLFKFMIINTTMAYTEREYKKRGWLYFWIIYASVILLNYFSKVFSVTKLNLTRLHTMHC